MCNCVWMCEISKSVLIKMARVCSDASLLDIAKPSDWILSNSNIIVIADKYPKAKFHYLVLSRQKISSILEVSIFLSKHIECLVFKNHRIRNFSLQLTVEHFDLLHEMYIMALKIIAMKGK